MPANIAQPCPALPEIQAADGRTVLLWVGGAISQYQDCAARHDAAVRAYRALQPKQD